MNVTDIPEIITLLYRTIFSAVVTKNAYSSLYLKMHLQILIIKYNLIKRVQVIFLFLFMNKEINFKNDTYAILLKLFVKIRTKR